MTTRGRSRGRGIRSTPSAPARPPAPATLAQLGVTPEPETTDGQFEDAVQEKEEEKKEEKPTSPPPVDANTQLSPNEGTQGNIEVHPAPVPKPNEEPTSMKKESSTTFNPNTPEFTPSVPPPEVAQGKLNPSAPAFNPSGSGVQTSKASIPKTTSTLNPMTPEFSSPGTVNSTSNHGNTRQSSSLSPSTFGKFPPAQITSQLNPHSDEFIPKSVAPTLSATAPEFIPKEGLPLSMQNGDPGRKESEETSREDFDFVPAEEEVPSLKPNDILQGFQHVVDQTDDVESEPLLKVTAEMLIKATLYPASFDRHKLKLENTVKAWPPSEDTLTNLAEMLIHWGIQEPSLRYTASRICQTLNDMDLQKGSFNSKLLSRLHQWFMKKESSEKDSLVNFSLFYAELFSRLRTKDKETPIAILGKAVFELLSRLLGVVEDQTVIGACHILKLTGSLLESIQKDGDTSRMDKLIETLVKLSTNETHPLSRQCVEIIVRVLELRARGWGNTTHSLPSPSSVPTPLNQFLFGEASHSDSASGDDVDTPFQAPVSNPDEWNEFLDDDNELIEDTEAAATESYPPVPDGAPDDEIDDVMFQEYEEFVQELEEHLLNMGEVDPEQLQEEQ